MIKSFRNKEAEMIFKGQSPRRIPQELSKRILRRLIDLNNAQSINDLRIPPSNHLEQLKGDREGQFSIRVNDRYRICFIWKYGDAYDVEFVDYH